MVYKWKEISRKNICSKYGRGIEKVYFEFSDKSKNEFYIKKENNPVFILAITQDNHIIITKQFRPGPNDIVFGLPGGEIDAGESPEEAAKRELLEETGHTGTIAFVTESHLCGYSTSKRYTFVAKNCQKITEQKLDKNEDIEVLFPTVDEFRTLLSSGKILETDIAYLGLDYLKLLQ
ncbi:MAG: ADP-ribose pyrophosphatase [Candidatus Moraniibacteriota bacterium]|nr:MAG: ADP-ribose pyrophosphatase [Candidatus Moranbacteria bacterium]